MKISLILLVVLIAGLAYVRLSPGDREAFHVDPLTAADPGESGVLLVPGPGAATYPVPPGALLAAFDKIVLASPRTRLFAGSVAGGLVTYVARSKWFGFPDYISVRAVAVDGGSQLAVYSRLRFGGSDLGVNAARLDGWLEALQPVE